MYIKVSVSVHTHTHTHTHTHKFLDPNLNQFIQTQITPYFSVIHF